MLCEPAKRGEQIERRSDKGRNRRNRDRKKTELQ
jgi:hypothetical protein